MESSFKNSTGHLVYYNNDFIFIAQFQVFHVFDIDN